MRSMKREEIKIRDPFILPYEGKYYMYGSRVGEPCAISPWGAQTGFDVYVSTDLENWSEPKSVFEILESFWATKDAWAPEVHIYNGKFYMFASFYAEGKMRATQALVADNPEGPFHVLGEPLTPTDWMCLDGTLYVEDGQPYLVFSHEWLQVDDGEIAFVPLKEDLSGAAGEPEVLFTASESGWATNASPSDDKIVYVTDGPWLVKEDDLLTMFWSSFCNGSYAVGSAVSTTGKLKGPWKHSKNLLFSKDGGHGMMFETFEKERMFTLHQPNSTPLERAHFFRIERVEDEYRLK